MVLKITRRTSDVEVILDQEKAREIVRLGENLSRVRNGRPATEGGGVRGTAIAKRIEELKADAESSTLHMTLEALTYSKWKMALEANTPDPKKPFDRDMVGLCADAVAGMVRSATLGGEQVPADELTPESLRGTFGEMTDGQITIVWRAVADLNGGVEDPKAAFDLASRTLGSSRS